MVRVYAALRALASKGVPSLYLTPGRSANVHTLLSLFVVIFSASDGSVSVALFPFMRISESYIPKLGTTADSRKYDAGSKSGVNASIATTSVVGSRFSAGPAPWCFVDVGVELPQAASRPPADPIATAPEAAPAAPRRNCRRLYRLSQLAIYPASVSHPAAEVPPG